MQTRWEEKALHGKYPSRIKEADVDTKATNQWFKSSGLKAETEGLIIAAQDQTLPTRAYHHHVIKDGTDPHCRICNKSQQTIDHVFSGCPELAKTEYIHRHNNVAAYIYTGRSVRSMRCKRQTSGTDTTQKRWRKKDDITSHYDMPIHTDRDISANRPDIVMKNNRDKKCILVDVAIPSDKNTSSKVSEKISKYKDLEIGITRTWQMKTEIIPVVIGALGVVKKGSEKFISEITGNINLQEIQKTTLLGTADILRKVLSIK